VVTVEDKIVAEKTATRGFPSEDEVVSAVRNALGR
jgi:hypothetical protein